MSARSTLAIIPCSKEKIWDEAPERGPCEARFAYTSRLHELCRIYAEEYADRWLILSAKYGFLKPDDILPETYDVTFSRSEDPFISLEDLRKQAQSIQARSLLLLLPSDYESRVIQAFEGLQLEFRLPLTQQSNTRAMELELETLVHRSQSSG